jgi:tetratricopeptide (TPR) repeat protein
MATSPTEVAATPEARTPRGWLDLLLRVCISLGLVYGSYLVAAQALAEWHFRRHTSEEIRKAIHWDPGNAEYYFERAHVLQASLEAADIDEVIRLYETATRLDPDRAQYWAALGSGYEWAGREEEARRAYERARQLFPNSPDINWKLGNFYIRAEKFQEALQAFRRTVSGDPEMRRPAFDLVWRAGLDAQIILQEMIPADRQVLLAYLNYLVEMHRVDEAGPVWARLLEQKGRLEPRVAFPYLDALIEHQQADRLKSAWTALIEQSASGMYHRSLDGNRITNGSFEGEILNGGLDWRVDAIEGAVVAVDSLTFFDGAHSLRIRFDGKHNVDYAHVRQYVPVEPNTLYRFIAYIRAQEITSDSGPRFEITDASDASKLSVSTEGVLGTLGWSPQQLEFRTGPETRLLLVRVVRLPSRRLDGRVSGTVWIDRLSLHPVE